MDCSYIENKVFGQVRNQREGQGVRVGGLSSPFSKIFKKCPRCWKKIALTIFIYWLSFSFKMLFKSIQQKHFPKFSPWGLPFVCCRLNVYRRLNVYFKKASLPSKIPGYAPADYVDYSVSEEVLVALVSIFMSSYITCKVSIE